MEIVIELLQDYGWYIFGGVLIVGYICSKFLPRIQQILDKRAEKAYAAKYHKDPDLATQRFVAQQLRIEKLQEQYEKDVESFKEKQERKEAMKREEILRKTENQAGNILGHSSKNSGYNPLMGDNTRSYRPARKSPCSGGGCG